MDLTQMIELAEQEAAALAANPRLADVPMDDYARAAEALRLGVLAERTATVRAAQQRVAQLREQQARREQVTTDHAAAEKTQGRRLLALAKELDAADVEAATASSAAVAALVALHEATERRNGLVRQSAGELRAAGLPAAFDGLEFATGGHEARSGAVAIAGRTWAPLSASGAVWRALVGALQATEGRPGVEGLRAQHLLGSTGRALGAVLDRLAPLPPARRVETLRPEAAPHEGAPVLMSENDRENHDRRRKAEELADQHRDARVRREYAQTRAELVERIGEERVAAVEAQVFIDGRPFADTTSTG